MKAIVSVAAGGPATLELRTVPSLRAGRNQLRIAVKAVGVNYPDALIIEDRYQYRPERPFSPGSECAGVVMEVGEGVTGFRPGDRVLGTCIFGAMAEEAVLEAVRCHRIPDDMPFDDAAALMMTYGTAYYALHSRARLTSGESVLVLGAGGGIGLATIQIAKAMGATVFAAASSEEKLRAAAAMGATAGVLYPKGAPSREESREFTSQLKALAPEGMDVVLDAVGGSYSEPALRSIAWNGRFLVVGFPAGIPTMPLNLVLLKSCEVVGVFWGASIDRDPQSLKILTSELLALYPSGKIRPYISSRYALADSAQAIVALADRRAVGKIVITV